MNSAVQLATQYFFAELNRRARSEGWEMHKDLTIHRCTTPPENCLEPLAWSPPFGDDHDARVHVSERAAQDVDREPGIVIHQMALRISRELPETMLLASAVVGARRAGLAVTSLEVEAALAMARVAVERHPDENFAWTVASSKASEVLPGFPTIDEIQARLGANTPQDDAAATLLNCLADHVIAERRAARATKTASPASPAPETASQEDGEGQEPPPRRQGR